MNNFWNWLYFGTGGEAGWHRIASPPFIAIDLLWGLVIVSIVSIAPSKASQIVILPLSGALIALAVAWAGNVQTLILSEEVKRVLPVSAGGIADYLFPFQLGILVLLIALAAWALAAFGVFDFYGDGDKSGLTLQVFGAAKSERLQATVMVILLALSSLAIRTCWQVLRHIFVLIELVARVRKAIEESERNRS